MREARAAWAAVALVVTLAGPAEARWDEARSGPFIVISEASDDRIREVLNHLEQFRHALGEATGRKDLKTVWPVTVVVGKGAGEPYLEMGRDGWMAWWPEKGRPGADWFHKLALLMFEDNLPGEMALDFEPAIAAAYSTMEVDGVRVVWGAAPAERYRTWQWAVIHKLTVDEATRGRVRVLLANLAGGGEFDPSLRNAFAKTRADMEREAKQYLSAGSFETAQWAGRPIAVERMFRIAPALPSRVRLLEGDGLLARGRAKEAVAAYERAQRERASTAGEEGLGLAYSRLGDREAAIRHLSEMAEDKEGAGAMGFHELARIDEDRARARLVVQMAAEKLAGWAEPYVLAAEQEEGPVRRAYFLKKAVELAPRKIHLWEKLAAAQTAAKEYEEATKSWRAAMRAAGSEAERQRLLERQRAAENARLDAAEAARKREQDEERAELDRLKREAEERIREAEKRANAAAGELKSKEKPLEWWDGPKLEKVEGLLARVDCLGKRARIYVRVGEKTVRLMIQDPSNTLVVGDAAEGAFACGAARQPRRVVVQYTAKKDAGMGTEGEVASVEFH